MHSITNDAGSTRKMVLTGRVISGLVVLFLLFDSTIKILKLQPAVEGTVQLGYPAWELVPIGLTLLICVIVYLIPRVSILGAILLTGYLGGATATQVRLQDPWFLFPVFLGVLAWGGLYLRNGKLRASVLLQH